MYSIAAWLPCAEVTACTCNTFADKRAANNKMERELGWLTDPLFFGDYPASNKLALGSDLPSFTPEQQAALKGSVDAIGVNVYTAR